MYDYLFNVSYLYYVTSSLLDCKFVCDDGIFYADSLVNSEWCELY